MKGNYFFFGLPIGTAFLAAVLINSISCINGFVWTVVELTEAKPSTFAAEDYILLLCFCLQLPLALFLIYIAACKISSKYLLLWLLLALVQDGLKYGDFLYDVYDIFLHTGGSNIFWSQVVHGIGTVLLDIYLYNVMFRFICMMNSVRRTISETIDLRPVGEGFRSIITYYESSPQKGAMLLLTTHIIWNTSQFIRHSIKHYVLRSEYASLHDISGSMTSFNCQEILELTLVPIFRTLLDITGVYLIKKKSRWLINVWIVLDTCLVLFSTGVYFAFYQISRTFASTFHDGSWTSIAADLISVFNFAFRLVILRYMIKFSDSLDVQNNVRDQFTTCNAPIISH